MQKVILLLLTTLVLAACGNRVSNIEKAIVGEWQDCAKDPNRQKRFPDQEVQVHENIRFNEDGSFVITKDGDVIRQGEFRVSPPDKQKLRLMNEPAGSLELNFDEFVTSRMVIGYNFDGFDSDFLFLFGGENGIFPFDTDRMYSACRPGGCYSTSNGNTFECWNPFR